MNKYNMKKISLLTFIMLLPLIALADAVEINGIYYNLIEKGKVAEVTSHPNIYKGDVVIPEKVTYNDVEYRVEVIRQYAFSGCTGLTSITIPNSVTSIGAGAFYGCNTGNTVNLTSVYISDLTAWCAIAFQDKESNPLVYAHHLYIDEQEVKELVIPSSVTSIGNYVFDGCSGLTSITIPNSVTSIGESAFTYCTGLTSITIPNSVTSIGHGAFFKCSGLTSITIPNSITSIESDTFGDCSGLISITIPNSVTSIGNDAFFGCSGLTSITIPNSVTSIGRFAFYGCSGLTSITIPNSVTKIDNDAFRLCSGLTSITIPNSVTSIRSRAFGGCSKVEDVYCYAENVPSTTSDAFQDSYIEYATLHVPAASVNAYKAAEPWKNYKQIVAIDGDTPSTPKCAKPTISYDNLKLTYSCETEGVEYISEIKDADIKKYYDNSVSLSATYEISVYATKSGYDNSDVATATLVFTNATFTTEGTSSAKEMNLRPLLIQANSGNINIQGAEDGTRIGVYNVNGQQIGSAVSAFNTTDVSTPLKKGDVAIVKVGQRSVKVIMK